MGAHLARLVRAAAAVAFVTTTAARASASPLDMFGFGSRCASMGSACAADTRDFSAVYYNDAGLASARSTDLSLGYFRANHSLSINGRDTNVDPARGLVGGLVMAGKVGTIPVGFGIATLLPDDRLSRARTERLDQPRWELYDNRSQLIYLSVGGAIRPLPWLEVGFGMAFLAATRGQLDVRGEANLQKPNDSQLQHEVDADLTSVRYPHGGIRITPSDKMSFALVYRHQAKLQLDLNAHLAGSVTQIGLHIPVSYQLNTADTGIFIPRQLVLGSSFHPHARVSINADLTWVQWSSYITAVSATSADLEAQIPKGLPVVIPPNPKPTQPFSAGLGDRIVPHLGVEWRAPLGDKVELPLRAGYAFERSPVPPQSGITNMIDSDRHVLSAGAGVRLIAPIEELPGDVRIDAHVQYSILPERITTKDSAADFVGDYRASGHIVAAGATLAMGF